jgi:hypothetical protein
VRSPTPISRRLTVHVAGEGRAGARPGYRALGLPPEPPQRHRRCRRSCRAPSTVSAMPGPHKTQAIRAAPVTPRACEWSGWNWRRNSRKIMASAPVGRQRAAGGVRARLIRPAAG